VAGTISGLNGRAFDIVTSSDGSRVYVGTENGFLYVINAATRTIVDEVQTTHGGLVHLALHPSLPLLYASTSGNVIEIDLEDLSTRLLPVDGVPQALAVSLRLETCRS